jgi:hypothetical protein
VIPAALNAVGVLSTVVSIIAADEPQTEVRNAFTEWVIDKIADRIVNAALSAIIFRL